MPERDAPSHRSLTSLRAILDAVAAGDLSAADAEQLALTDLAGAAIEDLTFMYPDQVKYVT